MDLGLKDRVYVVTGGSRGLGLATAEVLVADGARVVLAARSQDGVDSAAALAGRSRGRPSASPSTLPTPSSAATLVSTAQRSFGRLDGALLSSGGPPAGSVTSLTDDAWLAAFESVFLGVVRCAREMVSQLSPGGSLVLVLSSSVRSPIPGLALSNGLRPGLAMAAKTLADEVGPRGIRVNGLLPGRIRTGRIEELDGQRGPEAVAEARAAIPLGRDGDPQSSAGWRPSCCRLRRPTSPAPWWRSTAARPGVSEPAVSRPVRAPGWRTGCGRGRRRRRRRPAAPRAVPRSTTVPPSTTRMTSASRTVDSRWAMTRDVRPSRARARASWTAASDSESRCAVASSRITTDGAFSRSLAIASRCFSPPDSRYPRSPTTVSRPSGNDVDEVPDLRVLAGGSQGVLRSRRERRRAGCCGWSRGTCGRPG